ncbi:MAG: acylphosphatase [Betaproteobacteria bacterium]|nr:acylphosphatase [Betaproteobacteria bacterium]
MRQTQRIRIYGRVQGVFFRESMRIQAQGLGVTGWVRNRKDGSLEAMVQGSAERVAALVDWARRGPAGARVERIELAPGEGEYAAFTREPTG